MTPCQDEANEKQIKVSEITIYVNDHIIGFTKFSIAWNKTKVHFIGEKEGTLESLMQPRLNIAPGMEEVQFNIQLENE